MCLVLEEQRCKGCLGGRGYPDESLQAPVAGGKLHVEGRSPGIASTAVAAVGLVPFGEPILPESTAVTGFYFQGWGLVTLVLH